MLLEEIKNIQESKKDLSKFGYTVGTVLLVIAIVLYWYDRSGYLYFAIAGVLLIFTGTAFPLILKPFNKVWMTLALVLGWISSRVILIILFYLVLTPIGLIAKIFRKDFLNLKFDKTEQSYWVKRDKKRMDKIDYERQF